MCWSNIPNLIQLKISLLPQPEPILGLEAFSGDEGYEGHVLFSWLCLFSSSWLGYSFLQSQALSERRSRGRVPFYPAVLVSRLDVQSWPFYSSESFIVLFPLETSRVCSGSIRDGRGAGRRRRHTHTFLKFPQKPQETTTSQFVLHKWSNTSL